MKDGCQETGKDPRQEESLYDGIGEKDTFVIGSPQQVGMVDRTQEPCDGAHHQGNCRVEVEICRRAEHECSLHTVTLTARPENMRSWGENFWYRNDDARKEPISPAMIEIHVLMQAA